MGETDTAENSSIDENCTLWGVPCVLVRSVDPSFCSLQSLLSKVALKEPVILFLYFILNSYKTNVKPWSLYFQPQADLEDPLLNPSLWPPSTLVFWGEGLALPALALAALVANVVLLRFP